MSAAPRKNRTIEILLVEDSPGDVRLTQEAFLAVNSNVRLHVAADGVEAIAVLRKWGDHANSARPDIILLDLNLPKMGGLDVLAQIKDDAELKTIPAVILTASAAEAEIQNSYRLEANCYLCKPMHLEEFEILVKDINDFWLTRLTPPAHRPVV